MRAIRAIGVTGAMFSVLLASGCSGGSGGDDVTSPPNSAKGIASGEPAPPQTTSSTTSPAGTPSETSSSATPSSKGTAAGAPGVPEPARQHTKAGAKAFAKFYFDRSNAVFRDPQKGTTEVLELGSCQPCTTNAEGIREMATKKQHYDRDQVTYRLKRALDVGHNATNVFADLKQNPARLLDDSGNVLSTTPSPRVQAVLLLNWLPGQGWRVKDLSHE